MRFRCPNAGCGYAGRRVLGFQPDLRFNIVDGRLYHYGVGTAVFCQFGEEDEDRVLLLRRATHPVGAFTIPSGHWDTTDQFPFEGAAREVEEEAGLRLPRWRGWRRASGREELVEEGCGRHADLHYWNFYTARCSPEIAPLALVTNVADGVIGESDMIGWVPVSQVSADLLRLTKPAGYFLSRVLGVELRNVLER